MKHEFLRIGQYALRTDFRKAAAELQAAMDEWFPKANLDDIPLFEPEKWTPNKPGTNYNCFNFGTNIDQVEALHPGQLQHENPQICHSEERKSLLKSNVINQYKNLTPDDPQNWERFAFFICNQLMKDNLICREFSFSFEKNYFPAIMFLGLGGWGMSHDFHCATIRKDQDNNLFLAHKRGFHKPPERVETAQELFDYATNDNKNYYAGIWQCPSNLPEQVKPSF